MCFANDTKVAPPPAPPETLDQAAPDKKTANRRPANALALGTKAYRNDTGINLPKAPTVPSGPSVTI